MSTHHRTTAAIDTQAPASRHWFRMAILYFVIAVVMGVVMGASHDHRLMSVHAHLNLLGWVTMTLMGIYYHLYPAFGCNKVARTHFWLHQLALPVMMLALALRILGHAAAEPFIGIGSVLILLSVLLFAFNLLKALRTTPQLIETVRTTAPYPAAPGVAA